VSIFKRAVNFINPAFPNLIWRLPQERKTVYLTFDDGPYPEITESVLEILKHYHVPAIFFLSGKEIQQYGSGISKLNFKGHFLGNHGFSHNTLIFKSLEYLESEILETDCLIKDNFQVTTSLFRPPYGIWGAGLYKVLNSRKKDLILWSLMSNDFKWLPQKIEDHLKKKLQSGDIVVFHNSPISNHTTLKILPKFIEFCRDDGYEFKIIKESCIIGI
jgi:peptidoglycan/xylan/chitin deacetylase (PgdA/CDA1 family)